MGSGLGITLQCSITLKNKFTKLIISLKRGASFKNNTSIYLNKTCLIRAKTQIKYSNVEIFEIQ